MGKVLILLSIALALINARCFAHCMVQPCTSGAMHCHPEGKADSSQCSHQHNLTAAQANSPAPVDGIQVLLAGAPVLISPQIPQRPKELPDPSPPPHYAVTDPLPLRI